MTPERWREIERLFHAAREHPPDAREAFLDHACTDDQLRDEIRSLLDDRLCDSSFLDRPVLDEAAERLASCHASPLTGRTVDRYEVLELLGAGGMGDVYRARDPLLDRDVALKLLRPDAAAMAPLLREAQNAAHLNHPNICAVHEIGSFEGRPYLALEYVDGKTLAQAVRDGPLPLATVLDYARQVAAALGHAHERQILHKDLKSANVLVTRAGGVKVVDFGIARRTDAAGVEQRTGGSSGSSLVGTPCCMAPEVLQGHPADVRSDIWSLGVLVFEMASGRGPYPGTTAFQVIAGILAGPPGDLAAAVPAALQPIIRGCLAADPGARFQGIAEVDAALDAALDAAGLGDGARVGTAIPSAGWRPRAWRRDTAAMFTVLLFATAWFGAGRVSREEPTRLAVLPFVVEGTPDAPSLGLGLADSLITRLAGLSTLRVLPTASIRAIQTSAADPEAVARSLSVEYLLTGTAKVQADMYRFNLQLVRDGTLAWSDSFALPQSRLSAFEELMSERIAAALNVPLTQVDRARLVRGDTKHPEAHLAYLRGRARMAEYAHSSKALAAFERAVELDPRYARAYASLAHVLAVKYWMAQSSPSAAQFHARATEAAERAIQLEPALGEAHQALSTIHRYTEFEWDKTIQEGRKALELDPGLDLAHHNMATAFYHLGFPELSERESRAGLQANPESRRQATLNRARAAFYDGRYAAAEQLVLEIHKPGDAGHAWLLAEVRFYLGRHDQAQRDLKELLAMRPRGVFAERARASLATVLAARQMPREAETTLAPLIASPPTDHHATYRIATAVAQLGRPADAVRWLDRSARTGFPCYPWFARDPLLEPVRGEASFVRLLAELQADWELRRARYAPVKKAQ